MTTPTRTDEARETAPDQGPAAEAAEPRRYVGRTSRPSELVSQIETTQRVERTSRLPGAKRFSGSARPFVEAGRIAKEVIMGNGAKIGLVGVLALIVLVVAIWDKKNAEGLTHERMAPLPTQADGPLARNDAFTATDPSGGDEFEFEVGGAVEPPATPAPAATRGQAASGPRGGAAEPRPQAEDAEEALGTEPAPARPSEPARRAPSTAPSGGRTYVVQPGDTLSSISRKFYGTDRRYPLIVAANKTTIPDPNRVPLGATIVIPDAPAESAAATPTTVASSAGGRSHVVQSGENLTKIAERYLGSGRRYMEIYRANKDRLSSPDAVRVGMTLMIP